MHLNDDVREGVIDGLPIFLAYFSTAIAFGLVCRSSGLKFIQTLLFSVTNYTGAGQFLTLNLINAGASVLSCTLGVMMVNLRYMFMGVAIEGKYRKADKGLGKRLISAFGVTDEVFGVASVREGRLSFRYFTALWVTSYLGWISGTVTGYFAMMILPEALQLAVGVTCYAMFASLLAKETAKAPAALIVGIISAGLNSLLICVLGLSTGISFVISMIAATIVGAFIMPDAEEDADDSSESAKEAEA